MSRQIDYRMTLPVPADEVYATMVDPDFLRARLAKIGGPGASLLEHHFDVGSARYRLRHGLDAKDLPSVVRSVLPGDLVVERAESWTRRAAGDYAAEVRVVIPGTPASAGGGMALRDVDAGGSQWQVRVDVTVSVPFVGGRIEGVVAEQVRNLLAAEAQFTLHWITTMAR